MCEMAEGGGPCLPCVPPGRCGVREALPAALQLGSEQSTNHAPHCGLIGSSLQLVLAIK